MHHISEPNRHLSRQAVPRGAGNRAGSLVVFGDITVDLTLQVSAEPRPGADLIADSSGQTVGGSVTNTAIMASRLGLPVTMVGRVGVDPAGRHAQAELRAEHIDTQHVSEDATLPTATTVVVVPDHGERLLIAHRGANTAAGLTPDALALVRGAGALHLSGYSALSPTQTTAVAAALAVAGDAGIRVSMDLPPAAVAAAAQVETVQSWLPLIDLLIAGSAELAALSGISDPALAIARLRERTDATIAVKRGSAGATLHCAGGDQLCIPGMPVQVVDTTGSGDAFSAGLLYGLHSGALTEDPHAALVLAGTLGALTAGRRGAGRALPELPSIASALRTGWSGQDGRAGARAAAALPAPTRPLLR